MSMKDNASPPVLTCLGTSPCHADTSPARANRAIADSRSIEKIDRARYAARPWKIREEGLNHERYDPPDLGFGPDDQSGIRLLAGSARQGKDETKDHRFFPFARMTRVCIQKNREMPTRRANSLWYFPVGATPLEDNLCPLAEPFLVSGCLLQGRET